MVPPAPPPSPADSADTSKYKLNCLMGVDIGANTQTHSGSLGLLLKNVVEVLGFSFCVLESSLNDACPVY